jgi:Cu(I)/Ag(I) efflux system membrane fusion protein
MNTRTRTLTLAVTGVALITIGMAAAWQLGKRQGSQTDSVLNAASAAPAAAADAPQKAGDVDPATGKRVLYWHDPMVPGQRFDKPGKSPFMDMMLVPKYAAEAGGGVSVDARLAQSLGMRLATATRETVSRGVEAVATVGFNDRDVAIVQTRAAGFVERVYARAPGDVIAKGAPLVDLLVPEWLGAQEELLALARDRDDALVAAARQRLLVLGMTRQEIEAVERAGQPRAVITIAAPIAGVIQELGVRQGMTLAPGTTLARINGLGTVWLEAAVPETQAATLAPGGSTRARFAAYPGEVFEGKIAAVLPETNRDTRTLRVRIEVPNRGLKLRPGMYAQIALAGAAEDAIVVPAEAVIRSGRRAVVFVAQADKPGQYAPVEVELGPEIDGKLVVRKGLSESEQVVASGQFLIDSEASLAGVLTRAGEAPAAAAPERPTGPTHEGTGVVTAVDAEAATLSHAPIPTLQWGAMTMAFKFADTQQAQSIARGERVRFRFYQRGDDYVLERIEKLDASESTK